MRSIITVCSRFDFRGESFCYEADIDLPTAIEDIDLFLGQLPNRIAKLNGLDVISYKFEMLQSSEMEVIRFQSRIESAISNLPMRVETFLERYQEVGPEAYLQLIAEDHQLDLTANPEISKALKAAYLLGNTHKPKEKAVSTNWW